MAKQHLALALPLLAAGLCLGPGDAHASAGGAPSLPVIAFGQTGGEAAGFCMKSPAVTPGFAVKIYASGRVVTWNAVRQWPHPARVQVGPLFRQAAQARFFHIPSHINDTACRSAATTYLVIHDGPRKHQVTVRGFLDSKHPALARLLNVYERAAGI